MKIKLHFKKTNYYEKLVTLKLLNIRILKVYFGIRTFSAYINWALKIECIMLPEYVAEKNSPL